MFTQFLYRERDCTSINVFFSGSKFFRNECDERDRKKYRTECWLEKCIFDERICSAEEHVSFMPLKIQCPVPGSQTLLSFRLWAYVGLYVSARCRRRPSQHFRLRRIRVLCTTEAHPCARYVSSHYGPTWNSFRGLRYHHYRY